MLNCKPATANWQLQTEQMNYQEENNYPKAFLTTGIILAVLIALCYIVIINFVPQIDGTGGILVNYGTTDAGMGNDINSVEDPSVSPKANRTQPTKVTQAQPTEQKNQVTASNEKIATQNNEDAPEVAANTKKTSKATATTPAKPVHKKEVVNQNALYRGPSKTGNGGGDGTTNTPGNQGSKNGSPLAANYGDGGSGNGLKGTQWSFVSLPDVRNTSRTPGVVIVDVTIDADGNIIEAHADRKTRMSDLDLINRCISAIKGSKLTSRAQGSGTQKGQVQIKFDVE
jgi:hypothetical protein